MLPWQLVVKTRTLASNNFARHLIVFDFLTIKTILTDLNYKYAKKTG